MKSLFPIRKRRRHWQLSAVGRLNEMPAGSGPSIISRGHFRAPSASAPIMVYFIAVVLSASRSPIMLDSPGGGHQQLTPHSPIPMDVRFRRLFAACMRSSAGGRAERAPESGCDRHRWHNCRLSCQQHGISRLQARQSCHSGSHRWNSGTSEDCGYQERTALSGRKCQPNERPLAQTGPSHQHTPGA